MGKKKAKKHEVIESSDEETPAPTTQSNGKSAANGSAALTDGPPLLIDHVAVAYAASTQEEKTGTAVCGEGLTITYHGTQVLQDAELRLHYGNRYGLLGPNGCGKSTLLKCIAQQEIPTHKSLDLFYVAKEVDASDMSALTCVLSVDTEKARLEAECERLEGEDPENQQVQDSLNAIYERLDELDQDPAEMRAGRVLAGLGFNKEMQQKATKDYSGGWRMRIALAQALFQNPKFLLLDEPSNHLDIEAVVWLEAYLQKYKGILLVISHSQDFLNNVCTNIIRMFQKKLVYYRGNYDAYVKTRMELEENQMKRYNWEQDQIAHMKEYIARFGHGSAKLAKQAQSKEKTLAKMTREGLTEKVEIENPLSFYFPDPGKVSPPIMQFADVSFGYPGMPELYRGLNIGIDLDSRIALVGPNGAGKTTLQKMMAGLLEPTDGVITRNGHLRIIRFAQHFMDQLPYELNSLEYMQDTFKDLNDIQIVRQLVGRFGLTGPQQLQSIGTLSEGQKARVVFAMMAQKCPHIILLDEPTNALDMESIDALAEAIREFEGGVVLVSHDIRLIGQVAKEIWICEDGKVTPFSGDISVYKEDLKARVEAAEQRYDGDGKQSNMATTSTAAFTSSGKAGGKKGKGAAAAGPTPAGAAKAPAKAGKYVPPGGKAKVISIS